MRTAIPFSTWFRITERWESATSDEISRPRLIGPGCITMASGLASVQMLQPQAVEPEIFARRKCRFVLPLQLHAQHHDDVGIANRFVHIGGQRHAGRELRQFARQQRRRPAEHDIRAELRKQMNIRARHAAVRDIADDGHAQAFERLRAGREWCARRAAPGWDVRACRRPR